MHDMSPRDPYQRSNTISYQPSGGDPIRDNRLKGYTSHSMINENRPVERAVKERSTAAELDNKTFRRAQMSDPFRPRQDPGRAERPDEFFNGRHTTLQNRQNTESISNRFQPNNSPRTEKYKAEIHTYIDEVKRYKDEIARQRDHEKRQDLEMLKNYDPWSKQAVPKQRHNKVGLEKAYRVTEKTAPSTYAEKAFGKPGAGAPIVSENGQVSTHYQLNPDTQMQNVYRGNLGATAAVKFGDKQDASTYRRELSQQESERRVAEHAARQQDMEAERIMQQHQPFGKPGGGAPLGDAKLKLVDRQKKADSAQRKKKYAETLESQRKEEHVRRNLEKKELSTASDYQPWGKGVGKPERDASGKLIKKTARADIPAEGTMVELLGKPGGGAPAFNGTGKISPKKPMEPNETELFHPWGKPGAGAPTGNTRVAGNTQRAVMGTSPDPATKAQARREQQEFLEMHREMSMSQKNNMPREENDPEKYFRWGQGTSNPKRDTGGRLTNQHRNRTDVIDMNVDKGGGLGRKQKTGFSNQLHSDLENQAAERKTRANNERQREISEERAHNDNSSRWQGKQGVGAPRRSQNGQVHGRFALDTEVHHNEVVGTVKVIPKQEREKYGRDLSQLQEVKTSMRKQEMELNRAETNSHMNNANRNFGRQGHGAPLRTGSGSVVPHPSRARDKNDVEWKLNGKQGHKME